MVILHLCCGNVHDVWRICYFLTQRVWSHRASVHIKMQETCTWPGLSYEIRTICGIYTAQTTRNDAFLSRQHTRTFRFNLMRPCCFVNKAFWEIQIFWHSNSLCLASWISRKSARFPDFPVRFVRFTDFLLLKQLYMIHLSPAHVHDVRQFLYFLTQRVVANVVECRLNPWNVCFYFL